MVNDTYDLIVVNLRIKMKKLAKNPCPLDPMQVENKKEDLAGADWLIDYGLVLMSDHTYYCLGDTLIRPPFSFW